MTIPLRRARQFETEHVHFRTGGWGMVGHQHVVHSEIHGHAGLRSVHLGWAVYRWTYVRAHVTGAAVQVPVVIALALALLAVAFVLAS